MFEERGTPVRMFWRSSAHRAHEGAGLGLSIVDALVRAYSRVWTVSAS
jgi:signal transduction histidine kinase